MFILVYEFFFFFFYLHLKIKYIKLFILHYILLKYQDDLQLDIQTREYHCRWTGGWSVDVFEQHVGCSCGQGMTSIWTEPITTACLDHCTDGRFHEKENLSRCVRDALSRKCMVAFLLLDNPQESIMDLMEAPFEGGSIKFSKYMDSFPFPYYIVLRNIETLPRTFSDLLRQWFELMQYWRE